MRERCHRGEICSTQQAQHPQLALSLGLRVAADSQIKNRTAGERKDGRDSCQGKAQAGFLRIGLRDKPAGSPACRASIPSIHRMRRRDVVSKATADRHLSLMHVQSDEPRSRKSLRADVFWPGSRCTSLRGTRTLSSRQTMGDQAGDAPRGTNDPHSEPDPKRPTA